MTRTIRSTTAWALACVIPFASCPSNDAKAQNPKYSDHQILSNVVANAMDGPRLAIAKVRMGLTDPVNSGTVRRLGVCLGRFADAIGRDAQLRSDVAVEADRRVCTRDPGLCRSAAKQQIDQLRLGADIMRVVAREMQGEQVAEKSEVFRDWVILTEMIVAMLQQLAQTDWVIAQVLQEFNAVTTMVGEAYATQALNHCDR